MNTDSEKKSLTAKYAKYANDDREKCLISNSRMTIQFANDQCSNGCRQRDVPTSSRNGRSGEPRTAFDIGNLNIPWKFVLGNSSFRLASPRLGGFALRQTEAGGHSQASADDLGDAAARLISIGVESKPDPCGNPARREYKRLSRELCKRWRKESAQTKDGNTPCRPDGVCRRKFATIRCQKRDWLKNRNRGQFSDLHKNETPQPDPVPPCQESEFSPHFFQKALARIFPAIKSRAALFDQAFPFRQNGFVPRRHRHISIPAAQIIPQDFHGL